MAKKNYCTITPEGKIFACHRYYAQNRGYLGVVGAIDREAKKVFEDLTKDKFVGLSRCEDCSMKNCHICMAENEEKNLMPNLCFPRSCKMALASDEVLHNFFNNESEEESGPIMSTDPAQRNGDLVQVLEALKDISVPLANLSQDSNATIKEVNAKLDDILKYQQIFGNCLVTILRILGEKNGK